MLGLEYKSIDQNNDESRNNIRNRGCRLKKLSCVIHAQNT